MPEFSAGKLTFLTAPACCLITVWAASTRLPASEEVTGQATSRAPVSQGDRSAFVGARTCLGCHRSEYVSWLRTAHYNNRVDRFETTETGISSRYRKLTGNLNLCYRCHSVSADERFGRTMVESGTSCESCHGAAGGKSGWLNRHAVYGPNVTRLSQETPENFAERIAFCEGAGMVRSGRQYKVAMNCLSCHIAGNTVLFEAGHKVHFDNFSLIPYMLGEVRHNFHLNQRHNAQAPTLDTRRRSLSQIHRIRLYLIVEQLARMEVALNYLTELPSDDAMGDQLADSLTGIFSDAAEELEEFTDVLVEEISPERESLSEEEIDPLRKAIAEFEQFKELESPTRAHASAAAQHISALAAEFLARHDGRKLGALDTEFLDYLGEPVGEALEP